MSECHPDFNVRNRAPSKPLNVYRVFTSKAVPGMLKEAVVAASGPSEAKMTMHVGVDYRVDQVHGFFANAGAAGQVVMAVYYAPEVVEQKSNG
jgi:hypothetical protein